MKKEEVIVFIVYLVFMFGIGVYFFFKDKNGGEKTYFLGGRKMGAWVAALSAGASDMSAWVLMGLPTSVYALGIGQVWIAVGLAIGYSISWILEAPRLRKFSIACGDSITVPEYLSNRFLAKSNFIRILCAAVFLIAYTIYLASSLKACGILFNTVMGIDKNMAMYLATFVIVGYTFLGGFSAVCWTDFFQGMLIFGGMLIAPIFAVSFIEMGNLSVVPKEYWNPLADWKEIVSGLAWGLGYFGMPHIIVRFMSIRSDRELKKSAKIGIIWTAFILFFAVIIGIIGRMYLGFDEAINEGSLVFISMVRNIFPALISGVLLSAVLAASMSTADSQLLSAASSFASDVYKPVFRKGKTGDREMMWIGRAVVMIISVIGLLIAMNPNTGSIMALVTNAWGLFGSALGPITMLSLFWKRFSFAGAVAGMIAGAVSDILWIVFLSHTGIYELLPSFLIGLLAAVLVTLMTKEPSEEVKSMFEEAVNMED